MSIYIDFYLPTMELYKVTISDQNYFIDAYMNRSELLELDCVSNPEKL